MASSVGSLASLGTFFTVSKTTAAAPSSGRCTGGRASYCPVLCFYRSSCGWGSWGGSFSRLARSHGPKMLAVELDPSLVVKNKAAEIASELKGTSIFLIGLNCSMKTNLGKLLADSLRYYYFDSDDLVKQVAGGESPAESFPERDEKALCEAETEVLKQLSSMGRLVVCVGDGAVQSSTNLSYLRYGISIWIDTPLDLLANEVRENKASIPVGVSLPSSDEFSEVLQGLTKQYEEMKEGYMTADSIVSVQKVASKLAYENFESVTPEEMAVEVLKEVDRLMRVKKMMEAAAKPF